MTLPDVYIYSFIFIEAKNNNASPEWEIVPALFLFSNVASTAVKLRYVCPLMIKNPNLHALNEVQRLRQ